MNDALVPANPDAEKAVLGAVMVSRNALDEVAQILTGPDFYVPNHQTIYEAIRHLHDNDEPVDVVVGGGR